MESPLVRSATTALSLWKMTDEEGRLYFPETYEAGLICQIVVLSDEEYRCLYETEDDEHDRFELVDEMMIPPLESFSPDAEVKKIWRIRNVGATSWRDRFLERVGPPAGPGTMRSPPRVRVTDTEPGRVATVELDLKTAHVESTSISVWRMTTLDGSACAAGEPIVCE
jgi:hypothetical protein